MKRAFLCVGLAVLMLGLGIPAATADDACQGIDADGDALIDSPPSPGSGCVIVEVIVEPRKQNTVDLAFRAVHASVMWTPDFDPATITDASLCFGDADTPDARACVPLRKRGKFVDLNRDGHLDKIFKWTTSASGIQSGDTSACLTGSTKDGLKIEGCGAMTTKNG